MIPSSWETFNCLCVNSLQRIITQRLRERGREDEADDGEQRVNALFYFSIFNKMS